jgi:two-component system LytT family response regulator
MMIFRPNDFVYISDTAKGCVVHAAEISTLETCGNYTRVTLENGRTLTVRRGTQACHAKLDPKLFFRANRHCIVNLNYVAETRFADPKRILFILADGRQVVVARRHSIALKRDMAL